MFPTAKMSKAVAGDEEIEVKGSEKCYPALGYRHVQVALMFLLLTIAYGMRANMSVAIVAMTDKSTTDNPNIPTYDWDNKSIILSSFYWGYICLQIFAGELGIKFGVKWSVFTAMFINSTACMLIPLVAEHIGSYGVMGCRVVQGLSQGFFFPSVHNILGHWAPLHERSLMVTIAFSGPSCGMIFSMALSGLMASSRAGWPLAFYFFGALGYGWMAVWSFLGANTPTDHSRISNEERAYIENSLPANKHNEKIKIPWRAIFTSLPFWAYVIGDFGQIWGYSTLMTEMPNYINKIMKFDISANGLLSAAPYLVCFVFCFIFGALSDYIINRGYMSRKNARKLFNTIGTVVPAAALIILGFLPDDASTASVMMLVIAVGMNAGVLVGYLVSGVDLSPTFSGVLMGISNGSANVFAILAPLAVQFIVTDEGDKTLWKTVFIIAALVYIASDIFYVIFASGEVQWWDSVEDNSHRNEKDLTPNQRTEEREKIEE